MSDGEKKILDWSKIGQGFSFDGKKKLFQVDGQNVSYKEMMKKAYADEAAQRDQQELIKAQEPILKAKFLDAVINRREIHILKSFKNPTESMYQKQEDEDDGFYQNISKGENIPKFQEVLETIPAGDILVFKHREKTLDQWIFKSLKTKREYAIYMSPMISFQGSNMPNPAYYGILYNTNIYNESQE